MSPEQDEQSCSGKVRFPSRRLAVMALRTTRAISDQKKKDRTSLHAYPCQHCCGWHLGNGLAVIPHPRHMRRWFEF